MVAMGEKDAEAAVQAFRGRVERIVWISSGDVYRAYGLFMGLETGSLERGLLTEDSPLRSVLYPYRATAKSSEELSYFYEKILVERVALSARNTPAVVLRLPKVYGPGNNADLATVYQFCDHPEWRWTHGYVDNVAHAIAIAALHPAAVSRTYNVGEHYTPTVGERLAQLPPPPAHLNTTMHGNFEQNIAYDTTRIRRELGYREVIPEYEGLRRTLVRKAA
jgi:nucleoside-diphosphate-sugar epimerase